MPALERSRGQGIATRSLRRDGSAVLFRIAHRSHARSQRNISPGKPLLHMAPVIVQVGARVASALSPPSAVYKPAHHTRKTARTHAWTMARARHMYPTLTH